MSGKIPYEDLGSEPIVILALTKGKLPEKPLSGGDPKCFDFIWKFCVECWAKDAQRRPTAETAKTTFHNKLQELQSSATALGEDALTDPMDVDIVHSP